MAHPYHHALASVKKWGGEVSDYMPLHNWFDQSKGIAADFRHRALRHHAEGIFMLVIWTGKPASIEVVVPVVHRRGGAGEPTGASTRPRALFPAFGRIGINGRDPRVALQSGFPLRW